MPIGTEDCHECPVGQRTVRNVQWDRVLSGMSCGTEDCITTSELRRRKKGKKTVKLLFVLSICYFLRNVLKSLKVKKNWPLCQVYSMARKQLF